MSNNYKNICDKMIEHYKKVHVCPWHNISEKEINNYINEFFQNNNVDNEFFQNNNVDNEYIFTYLVLSIIKKVSGTSDCHTMYDMNYYIPMNFKLFNDEVIVNFPEKLKGYKVCKINDVNINNIIDEMESVVTYGTLGRRRNEIEKDLFNEYVLYGLPSLRSSKSLSFHLENNIGDIEEITFNQKQKYSKEERFNYEEYSYGVVANYEINNDVLIYRHSSAQNMFKELIKSTIEKLETEDISGVNTIIVDIRGNHGGNSLNNEPLINYLKKNSDKKLICLTDYRVFSAGRYALRDLIELGAITIGEEIGTPINCFGNNCWEVIDGYGFSSSSSYLHPVKRCFANTKEEYANIIKDDVLDEMIFKPDISVYQTKEDYLSGIDTILQYAINYAKIGICEVVKK